jgi:hypothetical protein
MGEREEELPEGRKLADQGNTDAKLFVPDSSEEQDELQEDAPEDAQGASDAGPEGGEAA